MIDNEKYLGGENSLEPKLKDREIQEKNKEINIRESPISLK